MAVSPHVVERVRTAGGKLLYERKDDSLGRVVEERYAGMMNTMLRETLTTGTAHKADLPGWAAAGKTGTSQDFRDAWFVGYTAYLVTGVWLGNDDSSPTKKATGGGLPVEVWTRFMRTAHQGVPVAALPGGGGFFSNFTTAQSGPSQQAAPPAPVPQSGGYRPAPARTSAPPPAPSARPEPAAGLDGWLVDRMFGR